MVSQRPIAIHALEHPTSGDVGVFMYRRILREAVRGTNPLASPAALHQRSNSGLPLHCYTQNTILELPRRNSEEEDKRMIREIGRKLVDLTAKADAYLGAERNAFMQRELAALEQAHATP